MVRFLVRVREMASRTDHGRDIEQDRLRRMAGPDLQWDDQVRRAVGHPERRGRGRPDDDRRLRRSAPLRRQHLRPDEGGDQQGLVQVHSVRLPLRNRQDLRDAEPERHHIRRLAVLEHIQEGGVLLLGKPDAERDLHDRGLHEDQEHRERLGKPGGPVPQMVRRRARIRGFPARPRLRHGRRNGKRQHDNRTGGNGGRAAELHRQHRENDIQDRIHPRRMGDSRRQGEQVRVRARKPVHPRLRRIRKSQMGRRPQRPRLLPRRRFAGQRAGIRDLRRLLPYSEGFRSVQGRIHLPRMASRPGPSDSIRSRTHDRILWFDVHGGVLRQGRRPALHRHLRRQRRPGNGLFAAGRVGDVRQAPDIAVHGPRRIHVPRMVHGTRRKRHRVRGLPSGIERHAVCDLGGELHACGPRSGTRSRSSARVLRCVVQHQPGAGELPRPAHTVRRIGHQARRPDPRGIHLPRMEVSDGL